MPLLVAAMLAASAGGARADAIAPCNAPFIFEGLAANIVPVEYLATASDQESADSERMRQIQDTAQHLAWLVKLDSWHQPTYGSLGVVTHLRLGRSCDPDEVLRSVISGETGPPVRIGQILVMLQGRIFIEGEEIFLQSRLRAFRRNTLPAGESRTLTDYFAGEGLSATLGNGIPALTAMLPPLDITFAPRALTASELRRIDSTFVEANVVHRDQSISSPGEPLRFTPGDRQAFAIQILDGGEWLKLTDFSGNAAGYIHANPEISVFLHQKLPELDFLNGVLGYLRVRQAQSGVGDQPPPPQSAARQAQERFARFMKREGAAEDAEANALAAALTGILAATDGADWTEARARFATAAALSPYRPEYRGLLGVADAQLCCAAAPVAGFEDPARSFTDSLSLDPDNLQALRNLDAFLASLAAAGTVPDGIDGSRLDQRREVVQKVLSTFKPPQDR
jgi:hypothetical protein